MDQVKLSALRDFAIKHFPRAQTVKKSMPTGDYHHTLYGFAALVGPNAPATVQAAAYLLQTVLGLLIDWPDDSKPTAHQRQQAEHQAVQAAAELCDLTNTNIPWLAAALATPTPVQTPTPAPAPPPIQRPALQPTPNQTTKDAALYLGVKPQTMREWAMNDSGPLRRVTLGRRNGWPTADLIRLGVEGWKPRQRKKPEA